jgi:hypothetical protein
MRYLDKAYVKVNSRTITVNIPDEVFIRFQKLPLVDDGHGIRERRLEHGDFILEYYEIYCQDCRTTIEDVWMVHDYLWERFGVGKARLCLPCFEIRFGQKITSRDLTDAPCNEELKKHLDWKTTNGVS